jgi:hypothetical protein
MMSKTRSTTGLTRQEGVRQHRPKAVLECLVAEWQCLKHRALLKQIKLPYHAFVV